MDSVISSLGEASPLRVFARTSVNQYLKTKKRIREIAAELKADALVEGTIAQSANHLRVTANLIQVSPERHIWAHSYEGEIRAALALESEIASAITTEIQRKLASQQQLPWTGRHPLNENVQLAYWRPTTAANGPPCV